MKTSLLVTGALWLISISALAQNTQTLIQTGAGWKYLVTSASPAAGWKGAPEAGFSEAGWSIGASPLGYGGASETGNGTGTCVNQCVSTSVPTCYTCTTREITTYFRKTINLTNAAGSFWLKYQRDDGIVLYANGTEIKRENLPSGPIMHSTPASAGASDEELWTRVDLPAGLLRTGDNVIAAEIHQLSATNSDIRFNLELYQLTVTQPPSDTVFTSGAIWKYLVTSANAVPAAAWKGDPGVSPAFSESGWSIGASPLGYGGASETGNGTGTCVNQCVSTSVPTCYTCTTREITTYFRKTINLTDVSSSFSLSYQRDDAIVIYINGTEVKRENLPSGAITHSTPASVGASDEELWTRVDVPAGLLRTGNNVIAVEIHQLSATNSDIRFNMKLYRTSSTNRIVQRSPAPPDTVFTSGAPWTYLVTSASAVPAAEWKADPMLAPAYNDANWSAGPSPLGYGGASETGNGTGTCVNQCVSTSVPTCYTCTTREITTYFRKTINLTDVSRPFALIYQRDDGIVIYINGTEVKRENIQSGIITHSTPASAVASDEELWTRVDVPAGLLRTGNNVIAVEIHQLSATNSDIRFNMKLWQYDYNVRLERGPYLQRYSDDPNLAIAPGKRSMTIRWSTNVAAGGEVIYRKKTPQGASPGSTTTVAAQAPPRAYSVATSGAAQTLYDVSVTLTNLDADTPYSYTIQSGTPLQGDAMNYFRTAPPIGNAGALNSVHKKTRMWVLGDFGKQVLPLGSAPDATQLKVRDGFNKYVQNQAANDDEKYIDLWLWLGDNAYGWGLPEQYQNYVFDAYDGRKYPNQQVMKQTPIFATPGNHDYHSGGPNPGDALVTERHRKDHSLNHYYDVVNNMTAGDSVGRHSRHEEYYSFDHDNIHFVSLDTYGYEKDQTTVFPDNSAQITWLKEDLTRAQNDSRIKWIIVFLHHPPYSMGSKNSNTDAESMNVREKLVKGVFDNYKIDLVLSGHSHNYERSRPMRGHYLVDSTFDAGMHNAPAGNNGQSSGSYNGTSGNPNAGSCFYYKSSTDPISKNHIVYVVNGSGGGTEAVRTFDPSKPKDGFWPHRAMNTSLNESGSMYIEVDKDRLDAKFIDENGDVKDRFTIIKDTKSFVLPPTDGATRRAVCECTDTDGLTHYTDLEANLLLSINKKGNDIGRAWNADFELKLQGAPGVTSVPSLFPGNYVKSPISVMNRHWTLKTRGLTNASTVTVRHYWPNADQAQLRYTSGGNIGLLDMEVITVNNVSANYTIDPAASAPNHSSIPKASAYNSNGAWIYRFNAAATTSTWDHGNLKNRFPHFPYSEFTVGWLTNTGGTVGGRVNQGSATNSGGRTMAASEYENVGETLVTAYPNPTPTGRVFFRPALRYYSFQLSDMQGRILKAENREGSLAELDLSAYPPGAYILVSEGEDKMHRIKLIKSQ